MMKRGFAFILCLALLAALAIPAGAAQEAGFLHPMSAIDGTALLLTGAPLDGGSVSVSVGGQSIPCAVSTLEESGLPVTYYCMVDQSSSFSNSQRQQQLRSLYALSDAMQPQDSMVLLLMAEEVVCGEPLTTPEARAEGIEKACVYNSRYTNLNYSIYSVLNWIAATHDGSSLACVLLITDGLDNANVPLDQSLVFQAIQSSALSFFTIAVSDPWADTYGRYHASQMAEYAQQSIGGLGVKPSDNYDSPTCVEDAVSQIVQQLRSGSVLRLALDQLPNTGSGVELDVTWSRGGTQITDRYSVDAALLSAPAAATQPVTTEAAQPEVTEAAQPETTQETLPAATRPESFEAAEGVTDSLRPVFILLLAGFVVVILLVVLAIVLWRRQRALEMEEVPETEWEEEPPVLPTQEGNGDFPNLAELKERLDFKSESVEDFSMPQVDIPLGKPAATSGCRVRLVPENHPEGTIEFSIGVNESVTLGRNERSDIVLNETDRALSSLHFELQWDSRTLYLRDRGSTNGTALNGVPLRPEIWARLEKKAVIQAGSAKYTVLTEKK